MTKVNAVMTIEELSAYLRIPKSTLYKLAQDCRIPGQKIGRQWRFSRQAIEAWLHERAGDKEAGARRDGPTRRAAK